jgi:hypothetical protein
LNDEVSTYFEYRDQPGGSFDPAAVATECIESGVGSLLVDRAALPAAFFDLSSGVAGELLHRLSVHGIRMAGVVPDPEAHSQPFQAFMREANRGTQFRFFINREDAVRWLESAE